MAELFPAVQHTVGAAATNTQLPLYRDIAWNYHTNAPIFALGSPVFVTGIEAVKSWAFRSLSTVRGRYPIFTDQYGSDFEEIIGKAFTPQLKEAECKRYCEECLRQSPYITAADVIEVRFAQNGKLTIKAEIKTIYGEEVIEYAG